MTRALLGALDGGAGSDADLARSFAETTRRGDVVGEMLRAAQAPRRGNRPAKVRDGDLRTVRQVREEQVAAFMLGETEIRDHGEHPNLNAAFGTLLAAMDPETRAWARGRLAEPAADGDRPTPLPASGKRPLLAADKRFQELRKVALDAFGELAGTLGPEVQRIGSPLSPRTQEELAGAAKSLSDALWHPSQHDVVGIARWCGAIARGMRSSLEQQGQRAATACAALVEHVDAWKRTQGGGA